MKYEKSAYVVRVIDDDKDLLEAIKISLEIEGWNVLTFKDAEEFLDHENSEEPGCILLDYQMPNMNGLELQKYLLAQGVNIPIIFLSAHAQVNIVSEAFKDGACDFLLKPISPEKLNEAMIGTIEKEEALFQVQKKLSPLARYENLTEQQKQVARLVARNLTSAVIGERLGKSKRTIERHRANVMKLLSTSSVNELKDFLVKINKF